MYIGPKLGSLFFLFFRGGHRLVDLLFSLQPKFDWKCNLAFLSKA